MSSQRPKRCPAREGRMLPTGTCPQEETPGHTVSRTQRVPASSRPPVHAAGGPHEHPQCFPVCSCLASGSTTLGAQEPPPRPATSVRAHASPTSPRSGRAEFPRSPEENNGGSVVDVGERGRKRAPSSMTEACGRGLPAPGEHPETSRGQKQKAEVN